MAGRRRWVLGALERAVLGRLWAAGPADVRAMHRAVGEERGIAPNTVQSALERLFRKGLARRRKRGRAFEYEAAVSREEWLAFAVSDALAGLEPATPAPLVAAFVDLAERAGQDELAELERLVRARRRRGKEDA